MVGLEVRVLVGALRGPRAASIFFSGFFSAFLSEIVNTPLVLRAELAIRPRRLEAVKTPLVLRAELAARPRRLEGVVKTPLVLRAELAARPRRTDRTSTTSIVRRCFGVDGFKRSDENDSGPALFYIRC